MTLSDTGPKNSPEVLSLGDFFKILRNRWGMILVIAILTVGGVAGLTAFQPKWYKAEATIRVEKPNPATTIFSQRTIDFYDPYFIREQFEILQSRKILLPVIEELELRRVIAEWLDYPGGQVPENFAFDFLSRSMLDLESRSGTSLIDVGVLTREDAVLAASIANAITASYEQVRIEFSTENQREDLARLSQELVKQESAVDVQRDEVERLRNELQISGVDLDIRDMSVEVEALRQLQRTALSLRVDANARETRWRQFASVPPAERMGLINVETVPDVNIQQLSQAFLVAEQQYVRLRNQLGENHPDFIGAGQTVEKIRSQLNEMLSGYEKSLEISYLESKARLDALNEELASARISQIEGASTRMRVFDEAVAKLRDEETLLKALRISLRQRDIDFQAPKRTVEVLNEAVPPRRPSKPNWALNLGLALIGGLVFGIAAAFLLDVFDMSFRSVADMERKLQLPILGVVLKKKILVTEDNFSGFETEPYRVIQTNLDLARSEGVGNVLAVQSSGPGEGKSTTLRNLAAVMAMSGQRVLIIDSDLRRPTQQKLWDIERKPGLCEYLRGETDLRSITRESGVPNLHVIPAGSTVNFSLSVLHQKAFRELVERLRDSYDKILLDSPPVIGISDASVIASLVDGVVFVVQHKRNPQTMTMRARQIIGSVDGRILGVVLNQVPHLGSEDYNYYTSNYYYYRSEHEDAKDEEKAAKRAKRETVAAARGTDEIDLG